MVYKTIAAKLGVLVLAASILSCCTGTGRGDKKPSAQNIPKLDNSYIFDGATLDGWEITNFGPQGPVSVYDGDVILGAGDGCTGITYKKPFPEMNYKVTLEAKRISGTDFFCGMTFPVGEESCTLIVGGWGGMVVGLSCIDGLDASENETSKLVAFDNDRWYSVSLEVRSDSIKAYIDKNPVVLFKKGNKLLSLRPEVDLSRPFGFASWRTTAAIRNIKLEKVQ